MIITDVNFNNLDILYKQTCDIYRSPLSKNKFFESNLYKILNNVSISFNLSEVSEYEYIFLKNYSTYISKYERLKYFRYNPNHEYYDDFYDRNYHEVHIEAIELIAEAYHASNQCNSDFDYTRYFMPQGLILGSCNLTITGINLASLIENNPLQFFIDMSGGLCSIEIDERTYLDESKIDHLNSFTFSDNVKTKFIQSFYKFIYSSLTYQDIFSDSILHDFYNKIFEHENVVSNNEIFLFKIHLDGKDFNLYNNDEIRNFLSYIKDNNIRFYDSYKMQFIFNTSMSNYFELFNLLDKKFFISSENLLIPNKKTIESNEIDIYNGLDLYKRRLQASYKKLNKAILDNYQNKNDFIKMSEMTYNHSKYRFSIFISFKEINDYLGGFIGNFESRLNNKSKDDEKFDILEAEFYQFVMMLISITKKIYDSFEIF